MANSEKELSTLGILAMSTVFAVCGVALYLAALTAPATQNVIQMATRPLLLGDVPEKFIN
jgi:hypothetical protein